MIIDITGVELTPGNHWKDCLGNGEHKGVECCCNECDYMMCCMSDDFPKICVSCKDLDCPRKNPQKRKIFLRYITGHFKF